MGDLSKADVALVERVLGHAIEPGLVRTLGPSTLAAIIQAARSEGPHPPKGEALPVVLTRALKLASFLRQGLKEMFTSASVPMELWDRFSNDVLAAVELLEARPSPGVSREEVAVTDDMVKRASIAFDEYVATIPPNDEVDTEPCVRAALEAALISRGEG